jgi:hypothetical protein
MGSFVGGDDHASASPVDNIFHGTAIGEVFRYCG